jgi:hypothetical protein
MLLLGVSFFFSSKFRSDVTQNDPREGKAKFPAQIMNETILIQQHVVQTNRYFQVAYQYNVYIKRSLYL